MSSITTISYKQIVKYCSYKDIPEDYADTVPNFIKEYRYKVKQLTDIIWVLVRKEFMSTKQLQLFAIWCARQVQHLMIDQRSIDAVEVAEKYINGLATREELNAADAYARAAAAYDAYARAVYDADAYARAAAAYATDADDATYARAAARAAYADAAARAAYDDAAYDAAVYAMRNQQIDYLLDLFERGTNFE